MANIYHGMSRSEKLLKECLNRYALNDPAVLPQTFGYLLEENPITGNLSKKEIVDGFDALVDTMSVNTIKNGPADAGMTFFGQFVDHDITLDATSAIGSRIDPRSIRNVRTPNLDLDCVYGDGPDASPHLYHPDHEGFLLFGNEDNPYDLARNCKGRALIGDPRNDENIIVSQIQGAFIMLHNILMSHAESRDDTHKDICSCAQMNVRADVWQHIIPEKQIGFEEVRRFIRLHYQWLVLHEFLPAFVQQDVIDAALAHDPFHDRGPIMPAEFSVAAYRFGHATVQQTYKLTANGKDIKLFDMLGFSPRKKEANMEMGMFFSVGTGTSQKALPVGTSMAETLFNLPPNIVGGGLDWEGHEIPLKQARKLALRNILRDRTSLHLPSGQQVARKLGLRPLPAPEELRKHHITKTPLWFYCLQEAEEIGNGCLTGVGGAIVASVFIRLLKLDPESLLNTPDFEPWSGFGDKFSMGGLMAFVEQHRDHVTHREDLYCGPSGKK